MKEFLSKYKVILAIAVLLILFIALSLLVKDPEPKRQMGDSVAEWLEDTKGDDYVVAVLAQTTCSHCIAFKPVMKKVNQEYDFKLYWFEVNTLSQYQKDDYKTLTETYELTDYKGTPYTFIVKNGEVVDFYARGAMEEEALIEFLKKNNVIKS